MPLAVPTVDIFLQALAHVRPVAAARDASKPISSRGATVPLAGRVACFADANHRRGLQGVRLGSRKHTQVRG